MTRRGTILAGVLLVLALASTAAVSVLFMMRAEVATSAARRRGERAREAAMSGLALARTVLMRYRDDPAVWEDNPDLFQTQLVSEAGGDTWYVTLYAPNPADDTRLRYGLADEAALLNLNTVDEETLRRLPGVPPEIVDALLDWRDTDDDTRAEGAEQDYYDSLVWPYAIRNGPLETLEEVLLVRGVTAPIVYGEDYNLNGLLDLNEDDGDDMFPPDDRDGLLARGLYGLATVWSWEPNVAADGEARLDLNGNPEALGDVGLSEGTLAFIRIWRGEGKKFEHPSDLLEAECEITRKHPARAELNPGDRLVCRLEPEDLEILLDRTTCVGDKRFTGLVNVNTAAADVLMALGLEEGPAHEIVDVRTTLDPSARATVAWLHTTNVLDAGAFKAVAPKLTARARQFRVRAIGFGAISGRFHILEAVLDTAEGMPRIIYMRNMTRAGMPFALDPESLERSL